MFLASLFIFGFVLMMKDVVVWGINPGAILLGLVLAYTILSFGTVGNDEVAAMFVFGAPLGNLNPGFYFAPLGAVSVRKGRATRYQDELPREPEQIFRSKVDTDPVPPGMSPPIRVKFGSPRADDDVQLKKDPYNIEMVAEVPVVVSWKISDATTFFASYDDVDAFRKILQDKAIELFGVEFATMTPAKALGTIAVTNTKLKGVINTATSGTGVEIVDAFVKPFIFSHDLNKAVVGVSEAKQKAEAVKAAAAGEKQKRIDEGAGAAEARKMMLVAEAIGTAKLAKLAKTPEGQVALWMETIAKAMENADFSIIPGSELFTAFAGIKEMLNKATNQKGTV